MDEGGDRKELCEDVPFMICVLNMQSLPSFVLHISVHCESRVKCGSNRTNVTMCNNVMHSKVY